MWFVQKHAVGNKREGDADAHHDWMSRAFYDKTKIVKCH